MNNVQTFDDPSALAEAAAKHTIDLLGKAIDTNGNATWVLAGGSTPLLAYKIIAANHTDAIDWSKVTVIMGDERIGPLDGPDNNWHAIDQIIGNLPTVKLQPRVNQDADAAAADYEAQLGSLPKGDMNLPRLDVVWLGVGQDGHTLSLFPQHDSIIPTGSLVIPVHGAPKPPSDRISLSLRALSGAHTALILASGADKKDAVTQALSGNSHLPIALIEKVVTTYDGTVQWYIDKTVVSD